jgi:hypothetical protein
VASAEDISALRLLIAEPVDAEPYTDARLGTILDEGTDPRTIASSLWREKAAGYANLVDVQEGNSKRTLSQLQKQALEMAASFEAEVAAAGGSPSGRVSRTRKIERQ